MPTAKDCQEWREFTLAYCVPLQTTLLCKFWDFISSRVAGYYDAANIMEKNSDMTMFLMGLEGSNIPAEMGKFSSTTLPALAALDNQLSGLHIDDYMSAHSALQGFHMPTVEVSANFKTQGEKTRAKTRDAKVALATYFVAPRLVRACMETNELLDYVKQIAPGKISADDGSGDTCFGKFAIDGELDQKFNIVGAGIVEAYDVIDKCQLFATKTNQPGTTMFYEKLKV